MFLYTLILSFLLSTCRASTHLQLFSHAKESKLALPAEELIENALKALGGEDSLKRIKGVTYSSPRYVGTGRREARMHWSDYCRQRLPYADVDAELRSR